MALTIDNLEIKVQSEASKATGGIEALTQSLTELKNVVSASSNLTNNLNNIAGAFKTLGSVGKINLTANINQLKKLQEVMPLFSNAQAQRFSNNIGLIGMGLEKLTNVPKMNVGSIASSLKRLEETTRLFDEARIKSFSNAIQGIAAGLSYLRYVEKGGFGSVVTSLRKIPEVVEKLDSATVERFAETIKRLTAIMAPLAKEMAQIGYGFSLLPKHVNKANKAMEESIIATRKANEAHGNNLFTMSEYVNQYRRLYQVISNVIDGCADLFNESNEYIEALNLFKVTMGDASDAALEYAEAVSAAMGIDPAEWISNQGVFQRQATGFGIVSEEAEIMSKNLTQLAYDLSSFFNTDVQTAMEKLQSGMTGQIKGLKTWGYNLSVAALQETALNLGIKESVRNMTEAQKAQLRYITLIQRSNGIMGDMAKTINTPSNALRILDAQITQFKRALGNLVSVIATKVIPYVQALVELMAEAAKSLAESWGFEIEDLPTNNLEMGAEVIEGIGDDVENTTDEVAKLKKQLMGFDELNVLNSSDTEADEKGTSNSLNIKLPEYDFLSNLDSKTREAIDEIKKSIKEFLPVLDTLLQIFVAIFAVNKFIDAKNAIKYFFSETKLGIGIMQLLNLSFGDFFALAKKNGVLKTLGSSFKSLWKNFKDLMSSLSPFAKTMVSIVALATEFNVVKDAVYDLTKGNKDLGESLLALIPTCAAVGVAMYAMLGPWGLVLAAVTAIIGAIVGFAQAEEELRKQLVHDTFYDNYGKKIGDIATEFENLYSSVTTAYDYIFDKQSDILAARDAIGETKTEVDLLISEVTNGATTIENAIPRIVSAFHSLYDDTKELLMKEGALIYSVLTQTGIEGIETYMQTVSELLGVANEDIDKNKEIVEDATKQFEGGEIGFEEYFNIVLEAEGNIENWSNVESEFEKARSEATKSLTEIFSEGINWDSTDLAGELSKITNGAKETKKTIGEAYQAIYEPIEHMIDIAKKQGNVEAQKKMEELLGIYKNREAADLQEIDDLVSGVQYVMQQDLAHEMVKIYDEALEGYWDLNVFQRLYYGNNKTKYAYSMLEDYKEDILAPIIADLEKAFGEENIFIDEIAEKVTGIKSEVMGAREFYSSGEELGVEELLEEAGKDTVDGLLEGLTSEQRKVYDEARAIGLSVLVAYEKALDINSPSVEMEKRGEYTLQGLANGLSNTSLLKVAIDNIIEQFDILSPIQKLWKHVTDWWNGLSLPDIDLFGNLGAKISGAFSIGQYASGGFPTMGQMFIARERGPELVGRIGNKNAVASNDQIITSIASAVYSAMMAAQEDGNSGSGGTPARIVVQIGDQAVGEASVRYINGQIVQTGASPIYS